MRHLRLFAAAVLAVAALHGAGWAYASRRVRAETEAYLDGLRGNGWVVTAESSGIAGWPGAAAARYTGIALDGAAAGVPVAWAAAEVRVAVSAADPGRVQIIPSGLQRLRVGAGPWTDLTANASVLALDGRGGTLAIDGLTVGLPGGPVQAGTVRAAVTGLDFEATINGVSGTSLPWPIEAARLEGALTRPPPAALGPAAAAAWRDAGGAAQVRALTVSAGPVQAAASGMARLDGALQPDVDLAVQVRGHRPALDRLVQGGTIPASAAVSAKAVLGLLASRDPDAPAKAQVRLSGGVLAVAGFPLLRLPPLAWAAGPANP